MIANRDVFVIRQQRVVRTEELAHVGCVIDGRIEIGVVADHYREMHRNIRRWRKNPCYFVTNFYRSTAAEKVGEQSAQRRRSRSPQKHQTIQNR